MIEILTSVPFAIEKEKLFKKLRLSEESADGADLFALIDAAGRVAHPKAIYAVAFVESREGDRIGLGGTAFQSRVLCANLEKVERVFPFIVTCGREFDSIPLPAGDFVKQFWLDTIKGMALDACFDFFKGALQENYASGSLSIMSPGSGAADLWPIEQQRELFSLFRGREKEIGVDLLESFLMVPNKTVSGIAFPTEIKFESCQLCPREKCRGRRAPFDQEKFDHYHS